MENSPKYQAGDVVVAKVFYDDGINFKARPAVIIANISITPTICYQVCRITGTNNTNRYKGVWVKCDTIKGRQMMLSKDSFIDAESPLVLEESDILDKIGICPYMEELEAMID